MYAYSVIKLRNLTWICKFEFGHACCSSWLHSLVQILNIIQCTCLITKPTTLRIGKRTLVDTRTEKISSHWKLTTFAILTFWYFITPIHVWYYKTIVDKSSTKYWDIVKWAKCYNVMYNKSIRTRTCCFK